MHKTSISIPMKKIKMNYSLSILLESREEKYNPNDLD